ncbi:MAG: polysaccharide biosynthesis/export family protein [Cyanobacteria bacterium J06639_1]
MAVCSVAIAAALVPVAAAWAQGTRPNLFDYQNEVDASDPGDLVDITDLPLIAPGETAAPNPPDGSVSPGFDNAPSPQLDVRLSQDEGFYTLGPGDRIGIEIFNVPEFSGAQQVLVDGTISLSLIGSVNVQGLTLKQVADEIAARYVDLLERPIVNVQLQQARPITITVAGEVERPGAYVEQGGGAFRVTQAIQAAGGITREADLRRITISRPRRNAPDQLFDVDLWELITSGTQEGNLLLLDGDQIFVATADRFDLSESQIAASANLSPDQIRIFLVGEVGRRGSLSLEPNTPLNQALLAAQGFNSSRANFDRVVRLIRLNPDGTVTDREYQVDFANNVNEESNPPLQDRDVLIVDRSVLATVTDFLSLITTPLRSVTNTINVVDRIDGNN